MVQLKNLSRLYVDFEFTKVRETGSKRKNDVGETDCEGVVEGVVEGVESVMHAEAGALCYVSSITEFGGLLSSGVVGTACAIDVDG